MSRRLGLVGWMLVAVAGCGETVLPERLPHPANSARYSVSSGDGEAFPRIKSYNSMWMTPYGDARLSSSMTYYGDAAEILATATVRENSGQVIQRTFVPTEGDGRGVLFEAFHSQLDAIHVASSCGGRVEADVQFKTWIWWPSFDGEIYRLGEKGERSAPSEAQAPCAPCPDGQASTGSVTSSGEDLCTETKEEGTGSGGGGGSDNCLDCVIEPAVTWCRVRYWYWKDTGEVFQVEVEECW